jgi:hypothetical protein
MYWYNSYQIALKNLSRQQEAVRAPVDKLPVFQAPIANVPVVQAPEALVIQAPVAKSPVAGRFAYAFYVTSNQYACSGK